VFRPGDSITIEIRVGEAQNVSIYKSLPYPVNLKQGGGKARSAPTSSVEPALHQETFRSSLSHFIIVPSYRSERLILHPFENNSV
jgi:hypothetical protein